MRGKDEQQLDVFSYVSPEQRVPQDHPLRPLRVMTDVALKELQPRFNRLYAKTGRPSIAPEKLLRALLLQALYSVRSERMLMEQLDYNLLFRWFVGLNMDDSCSRLPLLSQCRSDAPYKFNCAYGDSEPRCGVPGSGHKRSSIRRDLTHVNQRAKAKAAGITMRKAIPAVS